MIILYVISVLIIGIVNADVSELYATINNLQNNGYHYERPLSTAFSTPQPQFAVNISEINLPKTSLTSSYETSKITQPITDISKGIFTYNNNKYNNTNNNDHNDDNGNSERHDENILKITSKNDTPRKLMDTVAYEKSNLDFDNADKPIEKYKDSYGTLQSAISVSDILKPIALPISLPPLTEYTYTTNNHNHDSATPGAFNNDIPCKATIMPKNYETFNDDALKNDTSLFDDFDNSAQYELLKPLVQNKIDTQYDKIKQDVNNVKYAPKSFTSIPEPSKEIANVNGNLKTEEDRKYNYHYEKLKDVTSNLYLPASPQKLYIPSMYANGYFTNTFNTPYVFSPKLKDDDASVNYRNNIALENPSETLISSTEMPPASNLFEEYASSTIKPITSTFKVPSASFTNTQKPILNLYNGNLQSQSVVPNNVQGHVECGTQTDLPIEITTYKPLTKLPFVLFSTPQLIQQPIVTTYRPVTLSNKMSNEYLPPKTLTLITEANNAQETLTTNTTAASTQAEAAEMLKTSSKVPATTTKPVNSLSPNQANILPTLINSLNYNNGQDYLLPVPFATDKPQLFSSEIAESYTVTEEPFIERSQKSIVTTQFYSPQPSSKYSETFETSRTSLNNEYLPPPSSKSVLPAKLINEQLSFDTGLNIPFSLTMTPSILIPNVQSTSQKPITTSRKTECSSALDQSHLTIFNEINNETNVKPVVEIQKSEYPIIFSKPIAITQKLVTTTLDRKNLATTPIKPVEFTQKPKTTSVTSQKSEYLSSGTDKTPKSFIITNEKTVLPIAKSKPAVLQSTNKNYLPPEVQAVESTKKPVFASSVATQNPEHFSSSTSTFARTTTKVVSTTQNPFESLVNNSKYLPPDANKVLLFVMPQKPYYFSESTSSIPYVTIKTENVSTSQKPVLTTKPDVPQLTNSPEPKPVGSTKKPVFVSSVTPQKPDYFSASASGTFFTTTTEKSVLTTQKPVVTPKAVTSQLTNNKYLAPEINTDGSTKQPTFLSSLASQKSDYFPASESSTPYGTTKTEMVSTTQKPVLTTKLFVPQLTNNTYLPSEIKPVESTEKSVFMTLVTPQKPYYLLSSTSDTSYTTTTKKLVPITQKPVVTSKPVTSQLTNNKYLPPEIKTEGTTKQPTFSSSPTSQKSDYFPSNTSSTPYVTTKTETVYTTQKPVLTIKPVISQLTNTTYLPPEVKPVESTKKPVFVSAVTPQKPDYLSSSTSDTFYTTTTKKSVPITQKPVVTSKVVTSQLTNNKYLPPEIKAEGATKQPIFSSSITSQKSDYFPASVSSTPYIKFKTETTQKPVLTTKPVVSQLTNNTYLSPEVKPVESTKKPVFVSLVTTQIPDYLSSSTSGTSYTTTTKQSVFTTQKPATEGSTKQSTFTSSPTSQKSDYFPASKSSTPCVTTKTETVNSTEKPVLATKSVVSQLTNTTYFLPEVKLVESTKKPVFVSAVTPQKPDYLSSSTSDLFYMTTTKKAEPITQKPVVTSTAVTSQLTNYKYLPPKINTEGSTKQSTFTSSPTSQKLDYFPPSSSSTPYVTTKMEMISTTLKPVLITRPAVPQLPNNKYLPPEVKPGESTRRPVFVSLVTSQNPDYPSSSASGTSYTTTTKQSVFTMQKNATERSTKQSTFTSVPTSQMSDYFPASTSSTPCVTTKTETVNTTEKPVLATKPVVSQLKNITYLPPEVKLVESKKEPVFVSAVTPQKPDYLSSSTSDTFYTTTTKKSVPITQKPAVTSTAVTPQSTKYKYLPPKINTEGSTKQSTFTSSPTSQKSIYVPPSTSSTPYITTKTEMVSTTLKPVLTMKPVVPQLPDNKYLPPEVKPGESTKGPVFVPSVTPQKSDYLLSTTSDTSYTTTTKKSVLTTQKPVVTLKAVTSKLANNKHLAPEINIEGSTKQPTFSSSITSQKSDYFPASESSTPYGTTKTEMVSTTQKPVLTTKLFVPQLTNNTYLPPEIKPVESTKKPVFVSAVTPQKSDYLSSSASGIFYTTTTKKSVPIMQKPVVTSKTVTSQLSSNKYLPPEIKIEGTTKQPTTSSSVILQKSDYFPPNTNSTPYVTIKTEIVSSTKKPVLTTKSVVPQLTNNTYLPSEIKPAESTKKPTRKSVPITQMPVVTSKPVTSQLLNNKYLPPERKIVGSTKQPTFSSSVTSQKPDYFPASTSSTTYATTITKTVSTTQKLVGLKKTVASKLTKNKNLAPDISVTTPFIAPVILKVKPTEKPVNFTKEFVFVDSLTNAQRSGYTTTDSKRTTTLSLKNNYTTQKPLITLNRNNKYLPPDKKLTTKSNNRTSIEQGRLVNTRRPTTIPQKTKLQNNKSSQKLVNSTSQRKYFTTASQQIASFASNSTTEAAEKISPKTKITNGSTSLQYKRIEQANRYKTPNVKSLTTTQKSFVTSKPIKTFKSDDKKSDGVNPIKTTLKPITSYTSRRTAALTKSFNNKYLPPELKRIITTIKPAYNNVSKLSLTTSKPFTSTQYSSPISVVSSNKSLPPEQKVKPSKISDTTAVKTSVITSKTSSTYTTPITTRTIPKFQSNTKKLILEDKPHSHATLNNKYLPPITKLAQKPLIKPKSEEYLQLKDNFRFNTEQSVTTVKPTTYSTSSYKVTTLEKRESQALKTTYKPIQSSLAYVEHYTTEGTQFTGYIYPNSPQPPFAY